MGQLRLVRGTRVGIADHYLKPGEKGKEVMVERGKLMPTEI